MSHPHDSSVHADAAHVVLLHGIWFSGHILLPLAARLRKEGFVSHTFSYPTVKASPEENAARLHEFIAGLQARTVHLVAHSLGGIVVMHLFERYTDIPPGKVVLLGTPLQGSFNARRLQDWGVGRYMLGRSVEEGLLGEVPPWQGQRPLGMVAGTVGFGVGNLLGRMPETNDGAVLLSETRSPGLTDHVSLHTTHTGLLFSARVACQVVHFLRHGHFSLSC